MIINFYICCEIIVQFYFKFTINKNQIFCSDEKYNRFIFYRIQPNYYYY